MPYRFASTGLITGYLHFSEIFVRMWNVVSFRWQTWQWSFFQNESDYGMELRRIELRAFRMQSEHSTTELQPLKNKDY